MSILERILPIFSKNYPIETRDAIWNHCMSLINGWELNEANLENMCSTPLCAGFVGTGGGKEIVLLADALGTFKIANTETVPGEHRT